MNSAKLALYCVVALSLGLPVGGAFAQFGGESSTEADIANKELREAMDRAESMMGIAMTEKAPATAPQKDCLCVGSTASPAVARIEEALRAPLHSPGLDFSDAPLAEVVGFLQEEYRISMHLDTPALDKQGLGTDEPVTVNIRNMSLESALRLMLHQLGLTHLIRHEVLMITTPEEAESQLKLCVYDVHDLLDSDQPKAMPALVDAIISCAARKKWAGHGGKGQIRPVPPNLLVISQTQSAHDEIHGLLAAIRTLRGLAAPGEIAGDEPIREPEPADVDSSGF